MTTLNRLKMYSIALAFGGFTALTQVDFTLEGGSVHAQTGANGAGAVQQGKKLGFKVSTFLSNGDDTPVDVPIAGVTYWAEGGG